MRAIFSRPLTSRQHQPMAEWRDVLDHLEATCPRAGHIFTGAHSHLGECQRCNEIVTQVLLHAMQEDTAALPLLETVAEQFAIAASAPASAPGRRAAA